MSRDERILAGPITHGPAPEMPRPFALARIGGTARDASAAIAVEATPEERIGLAKRLGVDAVLALVCHFDLQRGQGDTVSAAGRLRARVRQMCVVSLESFEADIAEDFRVLFVPEGAQTEDVDIESDDEVTYEGGVLDLGEAATEQLALALDPFPRKPGAELPGPAESGDGGAFASLAKLRPPIQS
jgi:hypothetical protein